MKEDDDSRVLRIHRAEDDYAEHNAGVLADLSRNWSEKRAERTAARPNVVPVEADREQAEAFVAVGSAVRVARAGSASGRERLRYIARGGCDCGRGIGLTRTPA